MSTSIPFAAYRAKLLHTAPTPRFAAWLFLLAALVLLPSLAFHRNGTLAGLDMLLRTNPASRQHSSSTATTA
jgi:hypothetical protein